MKKIALSLVLIIVFSASTSIANDPKADYINHAKYCLRVGDTIFFNKIVINRKHFNKNGWLKSDVIENFFLKGKLIAIYEGWDSCNIEHLYKIKSLLWNRQIKVAIFWKYRVIEARVIRVLPQQSVIIID